MNPELPFIARGGKDTQVALYNRVSAISRITYLSGVDLQKKSADYLKALDLEMWVRWYKNEPTAKIVDEEFCQRASEVISGMEGKTVVFDKETYEKEKKECAIKLGATHVNEQSTDGEETSGRDKEQGEDRVCEDSS